jgi:hypothetical protein
MKRVLTTPPGVYRHYKGDLYRVLLVGLMSTNGLPRRPTVCYLSLSKGGLPDLRDEEEFHDLVWPLSGKVFATGAERIAIPVLDGAPIVANVVPRFAMLHTEDELINDGML